MVRAAIVVVALFVATPALSKTTFEQWEGKSKVFEGEGGTKIVANDIDFWTTGSPPRKFEIVGIIEDDRGTGPLSGSAMRSEKVAKLIAKHGGTAAILLSRDTRVAGVIHDGQFSVSGNQAYGGGSSVAVRKATTRLAVIKYVE